MLLQADDARLKQVDFLPAVHLTLNQLEFGDLPFGLTIGQSETIAAATAAGSLITPLAKEATRLDRARSSQESRSAKAFLRIIAWKEAMTSRASTSDGAPRSIATTVMVSDLVRSSRPIVRSLAIVRADGARLKASPSTFPRAGGVPPTR